MKKMSIHHPISTRPNKTDTPREIDSFELFRKENRVKIKHQGVSYYLHITRQGKLILTK